MTEVEKKSSSTSVRAASASLPQEILTLTGRNGMSYPTSKMVRGILKGIVPEGVDRHLIAFWKQYDLDYRLLEVLVKHNVSREQVYNLFPDKKEGAAQVTWRHAIEKDAMKWQLADLEMALRDDHTRREFINTCKNLNLPSVYGPATVTQMLQRHGVADEDITHIVVLLLKEVGMHDTQQSADQLVYLWKYRPARNTFWPITREYEDVLAAVVEEEIALRRMYTHAASIGERKLERTGLDVKSTESSSSSSSSKDNHDEKSNHEHKEQSCILLQLELFFKHCLLVEVERKMSDRAKHTQKLQTFMDTLKSPTTGLRMEHLLVKPLLNVCKELLHTELGDTPERDIVTRALDRARTNECLTLALPRSSSSTLSIYNQLLSIKNKKSLVNKKTSVQWLIQSGLVDVFRPSIITTLKEWNAKPGNDVLLHTLDGDNYEDWLPIEQLLWKAAVDLTVGC